MQQAAAITSQSEDDRQYDILLAGMAVRFRGNTDFGKRPLFATDATGLFEAYLDALPQENRSYHTCNTCRRFIETFGGIATIDVSGKLESALWHELEAPSYYAAGIAAMDKIVRKAKVTSAFLSSDATWGTPITGRGKHGPGEWTHFSVTPPSQLVFKSLVKTPHQAMAEKTEDRGQVSRAL